MFQMEDKLVEKAQHKLHTSIDIIQKMHHANDDKNYRCWCGSQRASDRIQVQSDSVFPSNVDLINK
uniref:Uncharacterized protein n=1 Tax=Rhizophora mucronata TaxID=61149 RepID=A0A2P2KZW5_RHIMU